MGETAKIREFVDAYRMAFEAFDAGAIADLFLYPCQITSDAGEISVVTVPTRDVWLPQLEGLIETYRSIGVQSADVIELQVFELTRRLAQASITWRLVEEERKPIYEFNATYTRRCWQGPSDHGHRAQRVSPVARGSGAIAPQGVTSAASTSISA